MIWLPLAAIWLDLCRQLSITWDAREQYSYGWFVPFLAGFLLWRRWLEGSSNPDPRRPRVLAPLLVLGALLLIPLRTIFEINADWPLISWVYTSTVVLLTLGSIWQAGGLGAACWYAFPVCLILVAVEWPYRIEKNLTHGLMYSVAFMTVEILGLMGVPALQKGNIIEISSGMVGVDEACSGIRSFQSAIMAGLVLGEVSRFSLRNRVVLVVSGIVLSYGFNVVRTLFLSWQAGRHGVGSVDQWHDGAGLAILVACSISLWLLTLWMQRRASKAPATPADQSRSAVTIAWIPSRLAAAAGIIGVSAIGLCEFWYRFHEAHRSPGKQWSVRFPSEQPRFQTVELSQRVISMIGHDEGGGATWGDETGGEWNAYFFRWHPRSIRNMIRARIHRPDVCLPAAGLRQVGGSDLIPISVPGLELPFRSYTYEGGGQRYFVFFCQWEDGLEQQLGLGESKQQDRLRSVLNGRRLVGQQTLEFILSGYGNMGEAVGALKTWLPRLVTTEAVP